MDRPPMCLAATVLGAADARELAGFYHRLLGWPIAVDEGDWFILREPSGSTGLSVQEEPNHVVPTWPPEPGEQQMMIHLDIGVEDMEAGVAWAVESGATLADHQPQAGVRVMLDPAGHPFCLFPMPVVS